ncbi:DUF6146 family protein [Polaribacter aquimarinus]|uniref:Lipoprotein n=1 Tax=Polaribacter aquimarinus TaxID=2100726 RepID=A0A2U2JEN2_9FLAO|nr:DUF6146 family protein [Polaribacter aquimarinus]PWG06823.1 hypothetical protein DIS07_03010 [Polaribacter aquimarinus]
MKIIKYSISVILLSLLLFACGSSPIKTAAKDKEEPVVIANDSLEYEIIIIDVGFNYFLNAIAQPKGFYSQKYLENRNRVWVTTWNIRVQNPSRFNPNIYENIIDYQPSINYGYEVNYKLFNYFLFAQKKYKMSLGGGFRTNRIN